MRLLGLITEPEDEGECGKACPKVLNCAKFYLKKFPFLTFHVEKEKADTQKCKKYPSQPLNPFALGRREIPGRMRKVRLGGEVLTSPPEYLWKQRCAETPIPVECISTVETNSRDNAKIQVHQDYSTHTFTPTPTVKPTCHHSSP